MLEFIKCIECKTCSLVLKNMREEKEGPVSYILLSN